MVCNKSHTSPHFQNMPRSYLLTQQDLQITKDSDTEELAGRYRKEACRSVLAERDTKADLRRHIHTGNV